jgi:hypothetical protein
MAGTLRVWIACLFLTIGVVGAQATQLEKITPDYADSTSLPIAPLRGGAHGPAMLDPTVPPPGALVVPEPSTIAMMFLGSGCLGALTVLRRRRRG